MSQLLITQYLAELDRLRKAFMGQLTDSALRKLSGGCPFSDPKEWATDPPGRVVMVIAESVRTAGKIERGAR